MKKALYALLFGCLTISLFGCGNSTENKGNTKETQEEDVSNNSKKEFYTFEEFLDLQSMSKEIYKEETDYMTSDEVSENMEEVYTKIEKNIGMKRDEKIKVRGHFVGIMDVSTTEIKITSKEDIEKCEKEVEFPMGDFSPSAFYIGWGELIELEGVVCFNRTLDDAYISMTDCKVTSGMPDIEYKCNVSELYKRFEDEDTYIVSSEPLFKEDKEFYDSFILNAEITSVCQISDLENPKKICEDRGMKYKEYKDYYFIQLWNGVECCDYISNNEDCILFSDGDKVAIYGVWVTTQGGRPYCELGIIKKFE